MKKKEKCGPGFLLHLRHSRVPLVFMKATVVTLVTSFANYLQNDSFADRCNTIIAAVLP